MVYITHRAQIPPVILPILKDSQITCHQLVAGHRQPELTPRCTTFCGDITAVTSALDKERSTSFTAAVLGQGAHSQPDIASELEPEAGHKTNHCLLDAHQTPPLPSAVATAAATAPTAIASAATACHPIRIRIAAAWAHSRRRPRHLNNLNPRSSRSSYSSSLPLR